MIELGKLLHLQGAVVWLPFTIVLYAGSSTLHRRLGKAPIANPTCGDSCLLWRTVQERAPT
jgi:hypothetical protein